MTEPDETMDNVQETLVSRRSRRSTAGNRMQAVMAEIAMEEPEAEDDLDFAIEKFEEDVFESDFESTDEEEAQREEAAAETQVNNEERQARKAARSRLEKATAAAHERQKMTFNPTASSSQPKLKPKPRPKRQFPLVLNPDTGELVVDDIATSKHRHSKRTHTVQNTSATVKRMVRSEQQKALYIPKRSKGETQALTQAELIARALDNEEGNLVEHRDYLKLEEEKRKRARVVRESVSGPLLRWISKAEDVKIQETPAPPPVAPIPSYYRPEPFGSSHHLPYTSAFSRNGLPFLQLGPLSNPNLPPPPTIVEPPPPPPEPVTRIEKVNTNYLVHEVGQHDKVSKPRWSQTMNAVFGGHVDWEEVKVYSGKSRPMSRLVRTCPITGLQAKYLDPRTGIPFANVEAYKTITGLISHEYVWSPGMGSYTRKSTSDALHEGE